jgi:hypothetical protein
MTGLIFPVSTSSFNIVRSFGLIFAMNLTIFLRPSRESSGASARTSTICIAPPPTITQIPSGASERR